MGWGCNDAYHDGPKLMGDDRISPRHRWKVWGDLRDAQRAVDGSIYTAAVSAPNYDGAVLNIDLGKSCLLNMVVIEHGPDEYGFPRNMAVLTSTDGKRFRRQIVVPGLRRITTAVLVKQVLTRYVRLQVTKQSSKPWSVAEVHLN
jgi:hypothetical protein